MLDKTNRQQFKFKQFTSDDYEEFRLEKEAKKSFRTFYETDVVIDDEDNKPS